MSVVTLTATQTVTLGSHPSEIGSQMQLWTSDLLTLVQAAPAVEAVWGSGLYEAEFIDVPAGTYRVRHVDQYGEALWHAAVTLTLTTATFVAHEAAFVSAGGGGGGLDAAGVRAAIGMASANLDTQLSGIATSATSVDGKLTSGRLSRIDRLPDVNAGATNGLALVGSVMALTASRLSRIDRLPDVNAGAAGGLALVGSEMSLTAAVLASLFTDADMTSLVNAIIARIETDLDGADVSVAAIAVAVRNEILNRVLAGNHEIPGTPGKLLQTASAADVITALATGTQVFGHSYLESIKRIEIAAGAATLSGAGTGTEVMTSSDASKTATFTVDASGNVTAVAWT